MGHDQLLLGYLFLEILIGFSALIYFGLRYRKVFLEKNLSISADPVWQGVATRALKKGLKKSDLIFCINQDGSASAPLLVFKDASGSVVGKMEALIGSREWRMGVGNDQYVISFPLSWKQSANLQRVSDDSVLASYNALNVFGKHSFEIPGYGTLTSERPNLGFLKTIDYRIGEKWIGTTQNVSATREIGKLAVLPSAIPLPIRMFILLL